MADLKHRPCFLFPLSQLNQRCPRRTRSIHRLRLHRSITHLTRRDSTLDGIITVRPWCGHTALPFKIIRHPVRCRHQLSLTWTFFPLFQPFIPRTPQWILHLLNPSLPIKQQLVLEYRLLDRVTRTHRSWIWWLRFISTYLCRRRRRRQQQRIQHRHTHLNVLYRPKSRNVHVWPPISVVKFSN